MSSFSTSAYKSQLFKKNLKNYFYTRFTTATKDDCPPSRTFEESALGLNEASPEEAREAAVPEQWKWEGNLEELFNKSFGGESEKRDG